jgi:hypothetical protein
MLYNPEASNAASPTATFDRRRNRILTTPFGSQFIRQPIPRRNGSTFERGATALQAVAP